MQSKASDDVQDAPMQDAATQNIAELITTALRIRSAPTPDIEKGLSHCGETVFWALAADVLVQYEQAAQEKSAKSNATLLEVWWMLVGQVAGQLAEYVAHHHTP